MPNTNSSPPTEIKDEDWYELLAWVKASERRVDILTSLEDNPKNTSDFAQTWNVTPEAVRYQLRQLETGRPESQDIPLIQALTPERQQYKLYGLTETGSDVVKYL